MECPSQVTWQFLQRAWFPGKEMVLSSHQNTVGNMQAVGLLVDDVLILHFDACCINWTHLSNYSHDTQKDPHHSQSGFSELLTWLVSPLRFQCVWLPPSLFHPRTCRVANSSPQRWLTIAQHVLER